MSDKQLTVGKVYRAKKPRAAGSALNPLVNDRAIIWIGSCSDQIQYDSPSLLDGAKYPTVTKEQFMKWMGGEINEANDLPDGEWLDWDKYKAAK